ncbi:MAG TPA: dihydrodipicolinate synthase family protein [Armatimonadota bacterium]|nr:dihydrodipicolinate synthase family protein [Armatimonadota bacterium]
MEPAQKDVIARGVWPTMVTPFSETGGIDWDGVDALIDWYLAAGVAGLFAVCLSSEMYALSPDERLALACHVVHKVDGRIPIVACGTFGGAVSDQAEYVRMMADTGVSAVVAIVCQLAAQDEGDDILQDHLETLVELTPGIPLGLYECPKPYHRLLSAELLAWAAHTERFVFMKDTSCSRQAIRAKIRAVRGTPLRWFNANTPTLLDSLRWGGDGYCSIGANAFPALYVQHCARYAENPARAEQLQEFLTMAEMTIRPNYPTSAKLFLRNSHLPIQLNSRIDNPVLHEEDTIILTQLMQAIDNYTK